VGVHTFGGLLKARWVIWVNVEIEFFSNYCIFSIKILDIKLPNSIDFEKYIKLINLSCILFISVHAHNLLIQDKLFKCYFYPNNPSNVILIDLVFCKGVHEEQITNHHILMNFVVSMVLKNLVIMILWLGHNHQGFKTAIW
jgi:hypothetical protein